MNEFSIKEKNNYEALFITKISEKDKFLKDFKDSITEKIPLENVDFNLWEERNPAYNLKEISKEEKAAFFLIKFTYEKSKIADLNDYLKSVPEIIRYRIINLTVDSKKMHIGKIIVHKPKKRFSKRNPEEKENSDNKQVS